MGADSTAGLGAAAARRGGADLVRQTRIFRTTSPPDPPRGVLLDALGTLVEMKPPAPRLQAALARRGVRVDAAAAARAMAAEIAVYRAEHHAAATRPQLEALRDRCAAVLEAELASGLAPADVRAALLEAVAFTPYPEVPGVLARLRGRGVRLAVVSNWDVSLHDVLGELDLRRHVDAVLTSAEMGQAKPAPGIFAAALAALDVAPDQALHVGDDLETDVAGARAAGCRAALVVRRGAVPPLPADVIALRSLHDLPSAAYR